METYEREVAGKFDPDKYNPDEWVRIAKDAGMKYIVITSKHHDGCAMFDSHVSDFTVVKSTPFHRDVIGELKKACDRGGIELGFYYSQAYDWHEKNGAGNDWDFGPDEGKDFEQ